MPPALIPREEVIDRLMSVLRRTGYDGASLAELSKATGLGKSSLYHHFPEGKDDMVRAVLDHLETQLIATVFAPLRIAGDAHDRLTTMADALDAFYAHGNESCVLAQLVLGTTRERFREQLTRIFTEWTGAIARVLTDAGLSRALARRRAEDAVLRVEGALVVASGLDDVGVFTRTLRSLPNDLLAPAAIPTSRSASKRSRPKP